MIEKRRYSTQKDFDKKSIYDKDFYEKLYEMQAEGRIKGLLVNSGNGRGSHILYLNQGLCAEIKDDTFPVFIYGTDRLSFEGGIELLEELLQTRLIEVSK